MKLLFGLMLMSLLLFSLAPPGSRGESGDADQPSATRPMAFSVNDFDWREMVPYLSIAAGLPGEQGLKALLENSRVLRAYIANEIQAECRSDAKRCAAKGPSFLLQGEVSERIDEIVEEGTLRRHRTVRVDYHLARQPFPFTDILALKTDKHRDAYLILDFTGNSYTAAQLREKYGAPYDTNVIEWYSVYKYRLVEKDYIAYAAFKIDPVDGAVITVAISLRRKGAYK